MKKVLLGTLAVLTLAACSKDEVVQQNPNDAISFDVVTNKAISRAADGYCNNVKPSTFNVWAAAQGKVYFETEEYKDFSGTYKPTSEVMRYWPESGTVDFFATKNEKGTPSFITTVGSTSLSFAGYSVEDAVAAQTDFIYAATKGAKKTDDDGKAKLYFRHALSQVEFKARNMNEKIYVKIDAVKVVNVKNSGTFTISNATTNNYVEHVHDDDADTDTRTGRGEWSSLSGKKEYVATFTTVDLKGGDGTKELTSNDGGAEYNTNTMYLVPQSLTPWDKSVAAASVGQENSYFIVNALIYNMPTTSSTPEEQVVVWGTNDSGTWKTKPIAIPVPASTTWEDGKRYVYTFVFTTTGNGGYNPSDNEPVLTPITLEVEVDDFVDAGNSDVEMKK